MVIEFPRLTRSRPSILGLVLSLLFAMVVVTATPPPASAAFVELEVTTLEDGAAADAGVACPASGDNQCTLRAAVQAANDAPGDDHTIVLSAGTYVLDVSGSGEDAAATGDLDVTGDITVVGDGVDQTIIDASGLGDRLFDVAAGGRLRIEHITLTGGSIGAAGGAIRAAGSDTEPATLEVDDAAFLDNQSISNGGAAIYLSEAIGAIRRSTFRGNAGAGSGGAIGARLSLLEIDASLFENNSAQNGGALAVNNESTATLTNSTISGNRASRSGGGITVGTDSPTLSIDSSTIAFNKREADIDGTGDGISANNSGSVTLTNSIVADNGTENCNAATGTITSADFNLDTATTCGFSETSDIDNATAGLLPLADNGGPSRTHALASNSDAIDAGDTDLTVDQRGLPRPADGTGDLTADDDIGALEEQLPVACNWNWTGATSSAWDEAGNWNGPAGEVPGASTDVVCIDEDVSLPVIYDNGQGNDTTIGRLSNTVAIDAIGLRIESGSLTLTNASDLAHLGIQLGDDGSFGEPTLIVEDRLDARSPSAWPRGTLGGAGTTTFHADLAGGTEPRTRVLDGHELLLTATTNMGTPNLFLENGSTIINTGTLEFEGGSSMRTPSPRANLLRNEGTILKTGTGTGRIEVEVDNADVATVRSEEGILSLSGEGTNDGDFVVESGATIAFAGRSIGSRYVHTAGSTVTGAGTIASTGPSGFVVDGDYNVTTTSLVAPSVFSTSYAKFNNDAATTGELIVEFSRPRGPGKLTVTGDVTYLVGDTRLDVTIDATGNLLLSGPRTKRFNDGSLIRIAGSATHDDGDVSIRESEMDVTGNYTHTGGDLELDAGTLHTPLLDVSSDAMLSGVGEVDGDVESAGTISPGLPNFRGGPGAIGVTGALTLGADNGLDVDLEGTGDGEFDRVDVAGEATLDGTLTVELAEGFTPQDGDEFEIITGTDVTGTFAAADLPQFTGSAEFEVVYLAQAVVLRFTGDITPAPSPSPPPAPPVVACPEGEVPPAGFMDVSDGNVHAHAVDCIAWYGITLGTSATTYDPAGTVTRGQKASFVTRLLVEAGIELPDVDRPAFNDIAGSTHAEAISQLADLGIVNGVDLERFDPERAVTRDQSAALVVRALEYVLGEPLPAPATSFTDIDGNTHEQRIAAAADAGIVLGATVTTFEPRASTRRDQMASLITRTMELLAAQGYLSPPAE